MKLRLLCGLPPEGEPIELRTHGARLVEAERTKRARVAAGLALLSEQERRLSLAARHNGHSGGVATHHQKGTP